MFLHVRHCCTCVPKQNRLSSNYSRKKKQRHLQSTATQVERSHCKFLQWFYSITVNGYICYILFEERLIGYFRFIPSQFRTSSVCNVVSPRGVATVFPSTLVVDYSLTSTFDKAVNIFIFMELQSRIWFHTAAISTRLSSYYITRIHIQSASKTEARHQVAWKFTNKIFALFFRKSY